MPLPLTDRELEQLNAYIDGELSAEERQRVEQRLANDTEWQSELEALRTTASMLGQLESVRVPRNFTLDPAIYGQAERARGGFFGSFGWPALSAAGAFIAVVLVFGVILFTRGVGGGPQVAMESMADDAAGMNLQSATETALAIPETMTPAAMDNIGAAAAPEKTEPATGALSQDEAAEEAMIEEEMMEEEEEEAAEIAEAEEAVIEEVEEDFDFEEAPAAAESAPVDAEAPAEPEEESVEEAEIEFDDAVPPMEFEESQGDFAEPQAPVVEPDVAEGGVEPLDEAGRITETTESVPGGAGEDPSPDMDADGDMAAQEGVAEAPAPDPAGESVAGSEQLSATEEFSGPSIASLLVLIVPLLLVIGGLVAFVLRTRNN